MTQDQDDQNRRLVRKIIELHMEPRPLELGRAVPAPGGGWMKLMHRHVRLDVMARKIAREKVLKEAPANWQRRKQAGTTTEDGHDG